jgi:hypothetical protein
MTNFLDQVLPRNRLKIAPTGSQRQRTAPNSWADFARCCDIRSGDGVVKFDPYPFQVELVKAIETHKTTIITKTRQLGITETVSNYFLWNATRNPGYLGVIFSKNQQDTSNIAKRLRRQIESIGQYTQPKTDNLQDIELVGGGRLLFRNSTPNGSRGLESVTHILFDECSFVEDIEEIYKSTIPTTAMSGDKAKIILLSTPNGQTGWYFNKLASNNDGVDFLRLCEQVRNQEADPVQIWSDSNNWAKCLIHWFAHPNFSHKKDTYLDEIESGTGLSRAAIEQEYNLSFTETEQLVFPAAQVRAAAIGEGYPPINEDPAASYVVGVDPAFQGNDYTVATVLKFDGSTWYVCDMYRKRKASTGADIYAIGELIDKWRPDNVGIEVNSGGVIVHEQLVAAHPSQKFTSILTSATSKQAIIERVALALDKGVIRFPKNSPLVDELLGFQRQGNKMGAASGKHDDTVMALAIALSVSDFKPNSSPFSNIKLKTIPD